MELTRAERWMLSNQCRLLESLYAEEADHFRKVRAALESGDRDMIAIYAAFIRPQLPALSEEDRAFVGMVLAMYDALQSSHRALPDQSAIDVDRLRFPGFDESEIDLRQHARFLIEEEKQFVHLDHQPGLVSAGPSRPVYARMLDAWGIYGKSQTLSIVQILYILEVGTQPTHS